MGRFNFRVWDEQNNKFIYFSFEGLVQAGYDYCRLSEMSDSGELLNDVNQCTNLKDTNNTLIYDNDILNVKYKDGGVINFRYLVMQDDLQDSPKNMDRFLRRANKLNIYKMLKTCDVKVIGNIHENPELLEV